MTAHRIRQLLAALTLFAAATAGPTMPAAAASGCQFTGVDRIVAVGDVHGAYDRFVEILRGARLLDDRQRWIGGRAHLVQLGDVVDRGPDSLKALDLLDAMQKDAEQAGGAVHALLGNHEVMRLLGDLRYTTPGEYAAFVTPTSEEVRASYIERAKAAGETLAEPPRLGLVEMLVAFSKNGRYGKLLRQHDAVVQINGIVFVHGGISPGVARMSCEAINETVQRNLGDGLAQTLSDPTAQLATGVDGPLWYRGLAQEPDAFAPMVDEILAAQHAKAIVVAHTVTPDGRVRVRFGGKVIQMDTGMQPAYVPAGRASALEIEHDTMTAIYADRRDVLTGAGAGPAPAPAR
jgi:hypothetical protein